MRESGLTDTDGQVARLRAPRDDRTAVVLPPIPQWRELLTANREHLCRVDYDLQGRSLIGVARDARLDLLRAARQHTGAYRDPPSTAAAPSVGDDDRSWPPILLAGHQPALFHPGVWAKNFALAQAAESLEATAVNLIIDNDVAGTASLRVPCGSPTAPRVESVVMDTQQLSLPIEERVIEDRRAFDTFGDRATKTVAPWVSRPLLRRLWPDVLEAARETPHLGSCLARARHQYEFRMGTESLEVPLSHVCGGPSFGWFLAHVVAQIPRFHAVYNSCLAEYRRRYRVRSRSHPAPDLLRRDGWYETPFWIWTVDRPRRRRLFARQVRSETQISDLGETTLTLDVSGDRSAETAVDQWLRLSSEGIKIRPRALMTTMYARMFLGDLFVHGIGGAKYDRLTDHIIREFFGIRPPSFVTVSATFLLPVARPDVDRQDVVDAERRLRDLRYNPDRYLDRVDVDESVWRLVEEKRDWFHRDGWGPTRRARHRRIEEINEELGGLVEPLRRQWLDERRELSRALRDSAVLSSREYSFCLFPHETLFPQLLELFAWEP